MLTERATRYLSTLQRLTAVPTRDVETILRDHGHPVFDLWLEFHDRYAGYVEVWDWDRDGAIWGLVHEDNYWLGPRGVDVEEEAHADEWTIMCANAHPSHQYRLDHNGAFLSEPAASFDIKVERNAVRWAFDIAGPSELISADAELLQRMQPHLIAVASDSSMSFYLDDATLVVQNLGTGTTRAWRRKLARAE